MPMVYAYEILGKGEEDVAFVSAVANGVLLNVAFLWVVLGAYYATSLFRNHRTLTRICHALSVVGLVSSTGLVVVKSLNSAEKLFAVGGLGFTLFGVFLLSCGAGLVVALVYMFFRLPDAAYQRMFRQPPSTFQEERG